MYGEVIPSLWFIRDTLAPSLEEPNTYGWSNDVLVRDKNNRKRSFITLKAAQKAIYKLNRTYT